MIRNLAILAHIDAGKTTLSERILFMAGEVHHPGNVDEGLATMDYLPEERAKGITIEAGLSTFYWKDQQYNLVDTPGHIDFGVEVDLTLEAVEGAVLVISGTGGVETQTVSAWKKLKERGILTTIFINKLDHPDSRLDDVLMELEGRLGVRPVLLNAPSPQGLQFGMLDVITESIIVHDKNSRETIVNKLNELTPSLKQLRKEANEAASGADDAILSAVLEERQITPGQLVEGLRTLFAQGEFAPCYCGSALQCRGIRQLMTGFGLFFPMPQVEPVPLLGTVVRIRHERDGNEYALIKVGADLPEAKWPAGFSFQRVFAEMFSPVNVLCANDILALRSQNLEVTLGMRIGLDGVPIGDSPAIAKVRQEAYHPLLYTRIECAASADWERIDRGLQVLQRSDPSILVQRDPSVGGWILKTVGEVQLEVILSRLKRELHCDVRAGEPEVVRFETLLHKLGPRRNEFQAANGTIVAVCIQLIPNEGHRQPKITAPSLSEESTGSEAFGAASAAFHEFCEQGVRGAGGLRGFDIEILQWEVPQGCPVPWVKKVCEDSIKLLITPADVEVFEPYMAMELECSPDYAGNLIGDLQARGGKIKEFGGDGKIAKILLEIPLQRVFGYSTIGRSISKGTASYALRFIGHRSLQA
jgi:elongation factor G